MVGGLGLALVMNQDFKFKNTTRAVMLLPFIVPTVLSHHRLDVDPRSGVQRGELVPDALRASPIPGRPGWAIRILAMCSLIMVNTWRGLPFYAITLLAGPADHLAGAV